MPALLHTGHESLIAELIFMLAGLLIAVAVTWYAFNGSSRIRRRRGRRSVDEDVD